jgi:hypothetical protein
MERSSCSIWYHCIDKILDPWWWAETLASQSLASYVSARKYSTSSILVKPLIKGLLKSFGITQVASFKSHRRL